MCRESEESCNLKEVFLTKEMFRLGTLVTSYQNRIMLDYIFQLNFYSLPSAITGKARIVNIKVRIMKSIFQLLDLVKWKIML